jgi:hypothetical protein
MRLSVVVILAMLALTWVPALAQEPAAGPALFGEKPDSAYINLLRSLKHNRFEVRLTDGSEFKGRATVTDSGLVLTDYQWRTTSQREETYRFVHWKTIQNIRAMKKGSVWPIVTLVSATAFFIFLWWGFSSD